MLDSLTLRIASLEDLPAEDRSSWRKVRPHIAHRPHGACWRHICRGNDRRGTKYYYPLFSNMTIEALLPRCCDHPRSIQTSCLEHEAGALREITSTSCCVSLPVEWPSIDSALLRRTEGFNSLASTRQASVLP
jgi:hypothetical protein